MSREHLAGRDLEQLAAGRRGGRGPDRLLNGAGPHVRTVAITKALHQRCHTYIKQGHCRFGQRLLGDLEHETIRGPCAPTGA